MKNNLDPWTEIAGLIDLEKKAALEGFHRLEFVPGARPMPLTPPAPGRRRGWRPAFTALAASLLLAAGLISFWLLRGSWQRVPAAPAWNEILADSFFYSGHDRSDKENAAEASTVAASPFFTAWAEAGLESATIAVGAVDPSAPVEHGDPEQVRQKISRAIRENALERLLTQFRDIHNKEA